MLNLKSLLKFNRRPKFVNSTGFTQSTNGYSSPDLGYRSNNSFLSRLKRLKNANPSANKSFLIVFAAIVLLVIFLLFKVLSSVGGSSTAPQVDTRTQLPGAKSSQTLNKEFAFPLRDQKGVEISKLKVTLQSVELRDQIIVQAQKVTAIQGRTFLVLNLKITNEYKKSVQVNTRDYFRLEINNNDKELLAPEIHNDPVEAQASSVKNTKLAFAIDESTAKSLKLRVGELSDDKKTIIDLNLK